MREKFMRFMEGRYGTDTYSQFLLIVGLVAILLSSFIKVDIISSLLYVVGWVLAIYSYVRIFSRNISKRYAENEKFLSRTYGIRTSFKKQKNLREQKKYYRIYKCPGCGQKIRVPKGKGKIEVRCPKCGATFIKKS